MRALPDMYAQLSEGCRPEGRGHTYQAKLKYPVLQLIHSKTAKLQKKVLPSKGWVKML